MKKDLMIGSLLDCYSPLLTEKQRYLLDCYYNEDLSLSEIAFNESITPQGARDIISRAAHRLCDYEQKLGLYKLLCQNQKAAAELSELADTTGGDIAAKLRAIAAEFYE